MVSNENYQRKFKTFLGSVAFPLGWYEFYLDRVGLRSQRYDFVYFERLLSMSIKEWESF